MRLARQRCIFYPEKREGGLLILPRGGSREDMVSTDRLHDCVKGNAPHWYQLVNYYTNLNYPNGSLVVITGCDKAEDYANASFSNAEPRNKKYPGVRYTWQPDYVIPWSFEQSDSTKWYQPSLPEIKGFQDDDHTKDHCIFVRTLRVSLSTRLWCTSILHAHDSQP